MNRRLVLNAASRAISHLSYTPLLGTAAAISLVRVLFYAALMDVDQFGLTSQLLLVSGLFGLFGNLGTQLVAHRDVPRLLHLGRSREAVSLIAQSTYVTVLVAVLCFPLGWLGLPLFNLTPIELALALIHGLATQVFATFVIESKSRLAMMQYARDMFIRAMLITVAGSWVAYRGWGGVGVIAAEALLTLAVLPFLAVSILANNNVPWSDIGRMAAPAHRELPWRASLILLAGSLIAYASFNLDRWFAASSLNRFEFGQYAFAWIPLMAAQSLQFLLNAGIFPLLARHGLEAPAWRALRLAAQVSLAILAIGIIAAVIAWFLAPPIIAAWLPKYSAALPLLGPLIAAAVFRISDFWSSFLIAAKFEWVLLKVQTVVLGLVLLGWIGLISIMGLRMTPESLAWLAFVAAATTHAASAVSAVVMVKR